MKILFAIKGMNNPGGGAERVLSLVASGLANRGHQVSLLSFDQAGGQSFFHLDPQVRRIELGIGSTVLEATFQTTVCRMVAMRGAVKREAPDVAVGFMHSTYIPLGLALVGTGIPLIASDHIVSEHFKSRPFEAMLLRLAPLIATRMVCVSDQARASFPSSIAVRMETIANPLLNASRRADVAGRQGARKILLSVGRFDPQKDQEILIEAFASIARDFPAWDLRIVGEGLLRPALERAISAHGLGGRVFLPGATNHISSEYEAAQLFVLPSRYESFGLAVAEALSHGLPSVGFADCQGVNEMIRPGVNGELVAATEDRADALAAKLGALMADDALRSRLAENAVALSSEHDLPAVLGRWERLLGDVKAH